MARQKTVVLTPAEKKALIVSLKADLKGAKDALKSLVAEKKAREKDMAAFAKEHAKRETIAAKAVANLVSQIEGLTEPKPQ